jgi:hypothetical protein
MADESSSNRELLGRELADAAGTDVEELHERYANSVTSPRSRRSKGRRPPSSSGPQRVPCGGGAREMYIAWKHEDVAHVMRDAAHFYKPGPGGPFADTLLSLNGEEHRNSVSW